MSTEHSIRARLEAIGIKIGKRAAHELKQGEATYNCPHCLDLGVVYQEHKYRNLGYTSLEVRPCFECGLGMGKHGQPGKPCTWADKASGACGYCGANPGESVPAYWRYVGPPGMSYADAAEWRNQKATRRAE